METSTITATHHDPARPVFGFVQPTSATDGQDPWSRAYERYQSAKTRQEDTAGQLADAVVDDRPTGYLRAAYAYERADTAYALAVWTSVHEAKHGAAA